MILTEVIQIIIILKYYMTNDIFSRYDSFTGDSLFPFTLDLKTKVVVLDTEEVLFDRTTVTHLPPPSGSVGR